MDKLAAVCEFARLIRGKAGQGAGGWGYGRGGAGRGAAAGQGTGEGADEQRTSNGTGGVVWKRLGGLVGVRAEADLPRRRAQRVRGRGSAGKLGCDGNIHQQVLEASCGIRHTAA